MKEYSFTERKYESQYKDITTDDYNYYAEFSVELTIDNLTEEEVREISDFIKNIATRPSAFELITYD